MKHFNKLFLLTLLLSLSATHAMAYDIAVENDDGMTIYYNYINDEKELEVTSIGVQTYSGSVVIPEEVTYMSKTWKVTSIGSHAFDNCTDLISITIPSSVTTIGYCAFSWCSGLTSITIPNSVTTFGSRAFEGCGGLTAVTIPSSMTSIGGAVFRYCSGLRSVTIPNSVTSIGGGAFMGCTGLTSVTIPNSVTTIGSSAFFGCSGLTSVTIPNSVTTIGIEAFEACESLTSVTIPNSVTSIKSEAFQGCSGLTSITIPNSVTSIGYNAFEGCSGLTEVISLIEDPFAISNDTFSENTFYNAALYVPDGTIEKYKNTDGWKNFKFIEEIGGNQTSEVKQCAKPVISYQDAKLFFSTTTEGAECHYTITDTDIRTGSGNEVQLTVTYHVSTYASKPGWDDSDVAEGTLCWIEIDPQKEGISNLSTGMAKVGARGVLIKTDGDKLSVEGADDGTEVSVFDVNGMLAGKAVSRAGVATIGTGLLPGNVAIVRMGSKAVKVLMK